jgi:hypothetical protein
MVRRDFEQRLRTLELARRGGSEIWVHQRDGMVRSLNGEQMLPREEAEALSRAITDLLHGNRPSTVEIQRDHDEATSVIL